MSFKKRNLREVRMKLFCTSGQEQKDTNTFLLGTNSCNDKIHVLSEIWLGNTLRHVSFSTIAAEARFRGSQNYRIVGVGRDL